MRSHSPAGLSPQCQLSTWTSVPAWGWCLVRYGPCVAAHGWCVTTQNTWGHIHQQGHHYDASSPHGHLYQHEVDCLATRGRCNARCVWCVATHGWCSMRHDWHVGIQNGCVTITNTRGYNCHHNARSACEKFNSTRLMWCEGMQGHRAAALPRSCQCCQAGYLCSLQHVVRFLQPILFQWPAPKLGEAHALNDPCQRVCSSR